MSIMASIGAGIVAILIAWGLGDFSSSGSASCTDSQAAECQQDVQRK